MSNINIENYGYNSFFQKQVEELNIEDKGLIPGRVIEVQKEQYKIVTEYGENSAKLKGSLFYNDKFENVYPAVGDFVIARPNPCGDDIIYQVLERKSKFSRLDSWNKIEQLVATNFDYVFIMVSLNNDFNIKRVERYLTASWQSGGIPVIILTKADLREDYSAEKEQITKVAKGVSIIAVSSYTKEGFEELQEFIKPSKTIVFLGSSGVGKSSLANAIAGEEIMKVNNIREDDSKGRHTTTYRHLLMLENSTMIIDTPGMRELGMWDVNDGLQIAYAEIEELAAKCKFNDCNHKNEPGCAIRAAIDNGELPKERYDNYLKLKREARFAESKENKKLRMQDAARSKSLSKFQKEFNKKWR